MKAHLALTAGLLLIGTAAQAVASSADFGVAGRISPGACYPTLSEHLIDFGDIKIADLNRHTATVIDRQRTNTLDISCDGATLFGVRGVDDRAASVGNHWYPAPYGLGATPRGEPIGAHYVQVDPSRSTLEGRSLYVTLSDGRGEVWGFSSPATASIPNDGSLLGLTDSVGDTRGPVPISAARLALDHFMVVAPASGLTLTGEVLLDGKATIELIYL